MIPIASLFAATTLGLLLAGSFAWAAGLGGALALLIGVHSRLPPRIAILWLYAFTLAFYTAVEWIVPALGRTALDAELLALDRLLFGETPAARFTPSPGWTELLSGCYLSYHVYLHGALIWAAVRIEAAERLVRPLFLAFALGMAGYLIVPATGPAIAWPALFGAPIEGGWMTAVNQAFISRGTSLYDVFPSLHVLMTLTLLDHDWRHLRRRFWIALGPAVGLTASTLYLRYHYAVDLLAGVGVWAIVAIADRRAARAQLPA